VQAADALLRPDWPPPARVQALVTTRRLPGCSEPPFDAFNLGLRNGEAAATAGANRALLVRAFDLPSPPRWLRQVHGTAIADADALARGAAPAGEPEADAAITRTPGRVLAVLTADCLPVLLCAEDGSAVAAAHAGWRGLAAGVLERTIAALGTEPARLLAWLGPAIGPASYEVGEEVRAAFAAHDGASTAAFLPTRPGHWRCDLYALARQRLAAAGVARVSGGDFDTFTDARFYSHRRDAVTGRFATLVWLRPDHATNADAGRPSAVQPTPASIRPAQAPEASAFSLCSVCSVFHVFSAWRLRCPTPSWHPTRP
jgi:YfiH family protein